ncbi:MAG: digeranylgeranylglycerophospholipid reductase [Candidatus Altiarchaeales archaeon HGW-Altiarchaeales-1]|nr:MAG: digeranylgeranylglycerophospholipid reductase [Candidatus Altiarchaeales archaeon HGW-Altiarchaeales-1]
MKEKHVDVVIVGAGPAGSISARDFAFAGNCVLVVEKKQEIGAPKRCGEMVACESLTEAQIKPNRAWVDSEIYGTTLYAPNGKKSINVKWNKATSYILERKIFEKHLAIEAINAGAKYMVKTRAIEVIKDEGIVSGIRAEYMDEEIIIRSKLVIAADGVDSKIAKSAGLNTTNKLEDYVSGFQYEMAGLKNLDFSCVHLYFGNDIAPKGYIWIFPKGKGIANVGIGINTNNINSNGKRTKEYLDAFIKEHKTIFEYASPIEVNAGGIPLSGGVNKFVYGGLIAIGDAAQHVSPIHGGGIAIALKSGILAAEVGTRALKEGDLSEERLHEYKRKWDDMFKKKINMALKVRMFFEKLNDNELNMLADILTPEEIMKLADGDYGFLPKTMLTKAPHFLPLVKKFLI